MPFSPYRHLMARLAAQDPFGRTPWGTIQARRRNTAETIAAPQASLLGLFGPSFTGTPAAPSTPATAPNPTRPDAPAAPATPAVPFAPTFGRRFGPGGSGSIGNRTPKPLTKKDVGLNIFAGVI